MCGLLISPAKHLSLVLRSSCLPDTPELKSNIRTDDLSLPSLITRVINYLKCLIFTIISCICCYNLKHLKNATTQRCPCWRADHPRSHCFKHWLLPGHSTRARTRTQPGGHTHLSLLWTFPWDVEGTVSFAPVGSFWVR